MIKTAPKIFGFLILLLNLAFISQLSAATITVDAVQLPATGPQETLINISEFGRYSVQATSEQGTAVQIIDKMAGPSTWQGLAGSKNGRIDHFFDVGQYKLKIKSHQKGEGMVAIKAAAFTELNAEKPLQLVDYKLVDTSLKDLEQRSYWIHIKQAKTIAIEAAGRSLADMRLWRDGNWLVEATPQINTIEPKLGKPLTHLQLSTLLQPGLYKVIVYGGQAQPWAKQSKEQPLYLRKGIATIGEVGRETISTSPFGIDRWLISKETNYFRLELAKSENASIRISRYQEQSPFNEGSNQSSINKKSRQPVAELSSYSNNHKQIITIRREADKPYILQRFQKQSTVDIYKSGDYWISTLHSGYGSDSIDATSILSNRKHSKERFVDAKTLTLSQHSSWQRRFNLHKQSTLFIEIKDAGEYELISKDLKDLEVRFEPFVTHRPNNYKTPRKMKVNSTWDLDPGYYVLSFYPREKGIIDLTIKGAKAKATQQKTPAQINTRYESVHVEYRDKFRLYLNRQSGVVAGAQVRKLPIDLEQALAISLKPKEKLNIPVSIPGKGKLQVISETGESLSFKLDKKGWSSLAKKAPAEGMMVEAGQFLIKVQSAQKDAQQYTIRFTPQSLLTETPLPYLSPSLIKQQPNFAQLNADNDLFFDLKPQQEHTLNVKVEKPGLYKLESTGLLNTWGNLRNRTITRLDYQQANGIGRNFLIQQYLREGNYQLSFSPRGQSAGHLGVRLQQAPLQAGSELINNIPARHTLTAGEALVYEININQAGYYQLTSLGLNGHFSVRLEDKDGWPLLKPGIIGNINQYFDKGAYRLVVLPMNNDTRVVSLLKPVLTSPKREGHGPFKVELNQSYQHQWLEPADKTAKRQADFWDFKLEGDAHISVTLSQDMEAQLIRLSDNSQVAEFDFQKSYQQLLAKGEYRVAVKNRRPNNFFSYQITLAVDELLAGQSRYISPPTELTISIGKDSLFDISSFGSQDVKATLKDAAGNFIASNDDRNNSWNFNIIQSLKEGRYQLTVLPVGSTDAGTTVNLIEPKEQQEAALSLPASVQIEDDLIHSYALPISEKTQVVAFASQSRDTLALTIEIQDKNNNWTQVSTKSGINPTVTLVTQANKQYRLKLWSPERRLAQVNLKVQNLNADSYTESQLAKGLNLNYQTITVNGLDINIAAAQVKLNKPGVFKPELGTGDFQYLANINSGFISTNKQLDSGDDKILWLSSTDNKSKPQAIRRLLSNQEQSLQVPTQNGLWLDLNKQQDQLKLVIAKAFKGVPALVINNHDQLEPLTMAIGEQSAAAITDPSNLDPKQMQLRLWSGTKSKETLPVQLKAFSFKDQTATNYLGGLSEHKLKSQQMLKIHLGQQNKALSFSLAKGTAAILLDGSTDQVSHRLFWADTQAQTITLQTKAQHLIYLNTNQQDQAVSFHALNQVMPKQYELTSKALFKQYFSNANRYFLNVELTEQEKTQGVELGFYGQNLKVVALSANGQIIKAQPNKGQSIKLNSNSLLMIEHGPGLLVSWINSVLSDNQDARPLTLSNDHSSQLVLQGNKLSYELNQAKAGFVHLSSSSPTIIRLNKKTMVFESGINSQLHVPAGKSQLQFEALSTAGFNDVLYANATRSETIGEGLGQNISLKPGDTKIYEFTLKQTQEIGIGVKASIDLAQTQLLNEQGQVIGVGVSQMHSLKAGRYFLLVSTPMSAPTVSIAPALVGLSNTNTGPSPDIIRQYQQLMTK